MVNFYNIDFIEENFDCTIIRFADGKDIRVMDKYQDIQSILEQL